MAGEDQFDPKKALSVETMTKSEFQRWLMEQDNMVKDTFFFEIIQMKSLI